MNGIHGQQRLPVKRSFSIVGYTLKSHEKLVVGGFMYRG